MSNEPIQTHNLATQLAIQEACAQKDAEIEKYKNAWAHSIHLSPDVIEAMAALLDRVPHTHWPIDVFHSGCVQCAWAKLKEPKS